MKFFTKVLVLALFSLTACVEEKVQITALYLDTMELYLDVGASQRLVATARPADAPITFKWFSSDEKVATVTQDGLVTLVSDGTATVTAMWGSYRRSCVVTTAGLKFEKDKIFLSPGATTQLVAVMRPYDEGAVYTWVSSNPDVVTVDENGLATYVQSGSAEISVSYGNYTSICEVRCLDKNPWDFRSVLSQPLSGSLLYSKKVAIGSTGRIMQGFDILPDQTMYYSQVSNDGKSVLISRAEGPGVNTTATMTLMYFGHGTQIAVEKANDGDYIWVGSNGTFTDGEYGNNLSFSRVKFEGGATHKSYAGDTYVFTETGEYDLQVSLDFDTKKLLLGTRKGGQRHFAVYNLDEVLNLPKKDVVISTQVEGAVQNPVVNARDLSDCTPISRFSVSAGVNKDTDVYSYSHQGHEVVGDYIYFYEGNAIDDGNGEYYSKAYLTTFNYGGEIVVPRTEVIAIADKANLKKEGLTNIGYAEAESLKIKGNTLYLGIACHNGPSASRYASILQYEAQLQ